MADSREKIARKRARRRRRRLKAGVKIFLFVFFCCAGFGGYIGWNIYKAQHAPDMTGTIDDIEDDTTKRSHYDITEDVKPTAIYKVINVGQGESIFIKCSEKTFLIDTGPDEKAEAVLKAIEPEMTGTLDYLILTSPNKGRTAGVKAVCSKYKPERVITFPLGKYAQEIRHMVGAGTKIEEGKDMTITIDKDAVLSIFLPEVTSTDEYDHSLMTYFRYGDTGFFAESDAGEEEESKIAGTIKPCDVVVLARNGSDSVNQHVDEMNSSTYIISASKESGVPSAGLMDVLDGSIFATYASGDISLVTNGTGITSGLSSDDRLKRN